MSWIKRLFAKLFRSGFVDYHEYKEPLPFEPVQFINGYGLELIKRFEGLKLKAYVCPGGKWTIGYGHTETAKKGMVITEGEAFGLLFKDVAKFEDVVRRLVKAPLTDNQFSALVSLAYNIGEGNLARSTLLKLLNNREYDRAADEFLKWRMSGGKVLKGLENRRAAERELFVL